MSKEIDNLIGMHYKAIQDTSSIRCGANGWNINDMSKHRYCTAAFCKERWNAAIATTKLYIEGRINVVDREINIDPNDTHTIIAMSKKVKKLRAQLKKIK